jgi:hypothetical protein
VRIQRLFALPMVALMLATVMLQAVGSSRPAAAVGSGGDLYFGAYGGSETTEMTNRIGGLGVRGVRMYIEWAKIEPTEAYHLPDGFIAGASNFKLLEYDRRIAALTAAGIRPVLMVGNAPPWAAGRERGPLYPGKDAAYANFLRRLIVRWSPSPYSVKHWELWPEPDFGNDVPTYIPEPTRTAYASRRAWGHHGAQFAQMLRTTYPVIKTADPNATVILGALGFDYFRNDSNPGYNAGGTFVYRFLDDVLANGGGDYFDWLGFNSYSSFGYSWEVNNPNTGRDIVAKASHMRTVMARRGVSKPLIAMEGGIWSCCGASGAGAHVYAKPNGEVGDYVPDEQAQAGYLAQVYARGIAADIKGIFWYLVQDFQPPDVMTDPDGHRGWYRLDLSPKPAVRAFQLVSSRLREASFTGVYTPARVVFGEVEAYTFTRTNGTAVVMMWTPFGPAEKSTVEVVATSTVIFDALGNPVPTTPVAGTDRVQFEVGFTPVYIDTFGSFGRRSFVPLVPRNQSGV